MYLALRFRSGPGGRSRSGPEIYVKVGFVWFEGVDDLHVQFNGPGDDNFCPTVKAGEYLAPHPETGTPTTLYSLEVSAKKPSECDRAPKDYVERLEAYWVSPNRGPAVMAQVR